MNLRRFLIFILSLVLMGCPDDLSTPQLAPEPEKPTPVEPDKPTPDKPTPEPEIETGVQFVNGTIFPVTVYSDAARMNKLADIDAGKSKTIEARANAGGTPFYVTYHITIESVSIPYYDGLSVVIPRIDDKKITTTTMPVLTSIETNAVYVKIQNSSAYSLTFRQGNNELTPDGYTSNIIMPGETRVYSTIQPGSITGYSFMKNTITALNFPVEVTEFQNGHVYSFQYNGTSLVLVNDAVIDIYSTQYGTGLYGSLMRLTAKAEHGGSYTIIVTKDEAIDPTALSYSNKTVSITLKGDSETERKLSLTKTGSLFTVGSGVTLTLDNNITLQGRSNNTASLVTVNSDGTLVMKNGSTITGNKAANGGGVYVDGGTLTMTGGIISGNGATSFGGGVYFNSGTFTKTGGIIYGSDATAALKNSAASIGHAVYVGSAKVRDTTADTNINLDSTKISDEGGWESSVSATLHWINDTAENNSSYTIVVPKDEAIDPASLLYSGKTVSITLKGSGSERKVSLTKTGSLFTIESGVTLILENNITLQGRTDNTASLVRVNSGGTLIMKTGSTINGNKAPSGGGVYVDGGTLTMSGGTISGNTATDNGGGVFVDGGTFTKTDGKVYGSEASATLKNSAGSIGHAICVSADLPKVRNTTASETIGLDSAVSGTRGGWEEVPFSAAILNWIKDHAVNGGDYTVIITKNEAINPASLSYSGKTVSITFKGDGTERKISLTTTGSLFTVGSGVTLTLDNNVTLQGLRYNTASLVIVNSGGTLVMKDGSQVTGNSTTSVGGGVYVNSGTLTMEGGIISDNTTASGSGVGGGGVYVGSGTFTMEGGTISGNFAPAAYGGGVYVRTGTFTKSSSGGVIYGSDASESSKNRSTFAGDAVYVYSPLNYRNTTAGTSVGLDSRVSNSAGGWE